MECISKRWSLTLIALLAVPLLLAGCKKLTGGQKLTPDHGPLEGNTEVTIYVPECGDLRKVQKVLFGDKSQPIVGQNEEEVKVRTIQGDAEGNLPVVLLLENQARCNTGAQFAYRKIDQSGVNAIFEQGHTPGERRVGGWRPGAE